MLIENHEDEEDEEGEVKVYRARRRGFDRK